MASWRKLRPYAAVLAVAGVLLAAAAFAKSYFLSQVRRRVEAAFVYDDFRLSFLPPALVLENVRSKPPSNVFAARSVSIRMSSWSLLKRDKPFVILMDGPVLTLDEAALRGGDRKDRGVFPLPFIIERGLIRDGRLVFEGEDLALDLIGFRAVLGQKGAAFSFRGEWEEGSVRHRPSGLALSAAGGLTLFGRGEEITLRRLELAGDDLSLSAKGRVVGTGDPRLDLKILAQLPAEVPARIIGLPFVWGGRLSAKGDLVRDAQGLRYATSLTSRDLALNRVPLGRVSGALKVGPDLAGRVDLDILSRDGRPATGAIEFDRSRVHGSVQGFELDSILSGFDIPWPVRSPFWGSFTVSNGRVTADGAFRDEVKRTAGARFAFQGPVSLTWDGTDTLFFASPGLRSSFADVKVKGRLNLSSDCDVEIGGSVLDVRQIRRFLSRVLRQKWTFPEIRGSGQARVLLTGRSADPRVDAEFDMEQAGFALFNARSVTGTFQAVSRRFRGRFAVKDARYDGEIEVEADAEKYTTRLRAERAQVQAVLAGLEIPLPLAGEAKGAFEVSQRAADRDVTAEGDFSAERLRFSDQALSGVAGRLGWRDGALTLAGLRFGLHRGEVRGDARLGLLLDHGFEVDLTGEGLDLAQFAPRLRGRLGFACKGKGTFGSETAPGTFRLDDFVVDPFQPTRAAGTIEVGYDFAANVMTLKINGNFEPGDNDFQADGRIPFGAGAPGVNLKGSFANLDLLVPFKGAQGVVNYLGEVRAGKGRPEVRGVVDFQGPVFPIPYFAHAVRDYSGLVFVEDQRLIVRSLRGTIGGGPIEGAGELRLDGGTVAEIDLRAEGRDMLVSPYERTRGLADGSARLIKDAGRFLLEGTFDVRNLSWRRDLYEKLAFSTVEELVPRPPGFFDDLNINLRFRSAGDAWMDNALGRVKARFDLSVTGSVRLPILLGDIEALEGIVNFQDREFNILKGRVSFLNPLAVEPTLDIRGETYVKDYRVTVSVAGTPERLKTEFNSSPPLPPEDVLALLALGEAFRRTYSYDRSAQQSTASLVSFQLAERAKLGAEKFLLVDRFRIDPFLMGTSAEMTARLSVGKKITKDLFILYSTNLTTQREEIVRIEWELSKDFSLIGIRNEMGRLSLDLKLRRRF
ncbi:MAG: translocation/assembly module TamB domain-containing protein [Candidatus Aminicenantes bacterium]|nr:translocation/assembly module TamB domain-containing protein [Candidatus Aminicenantes bacterium]